MYIFPFMANWSILVYPVPNKVAVVIEADVEKSL